jgi:hypothetical protein
MVKMSTNRLQWRSPRAVNGLHRAAAASASTYRARLLPFLSFA